MLKQVAQTPLGHGPDFKHHKPQSGQYLNALGSQLASQYACYKLKYKQAIAESESI